MSTREKGAVVASSRELDGEWRLRAPGGGAPRHSGWTALVPGGVHETLLAAGDIDDPFTSRGAEDAAWIEEREWSFEREIPGLGPRGIGERDLLVFDRLDGRASVLLDGVELATHHSTFYPLEIDVSGRVDTDAALQVLFEPIARAWEGRHIPDAWGWYYPEERVWARKPQCQFSWDHCPRYVNVSVGAVRLQRRRCARLVQPWVRVLDLDAAAAVVSVRATVEQWDGAELQADVALAWRGQTVASASVPVEGAAIRAVLTVKDPRAWFPNGAGEQARYQASIVLRAIKGADAAGSVVDEWSRAVGLRTIELRREPQTDEPGAESFTFAVNGVPVFIKGANWVPPDLLATRSGHRVEQLEMLAGAGGNMIRNWGGGDYETDEFYEACDRLGILVWQDNMYSCARYPDDDPEFLALAAAETEYQIARLRNHPSLALWCGSNENEWHEDTFYPERPGHQFPGSHLYRELLPTAGRSTVSGGALLALQPVWRERPQR